MKGNCENFNEALQTLLKDLQAGCHTKEKDDYGNPIVYLDAMVYYCDPKAKVDDVYRKKYPIDVDYSYVSKLEDDIQNIRHSMEECTCFQLNYIAYFQQEMQNLYRGLQIYKRRGGTSCHFVCRYIDFIEFVLAIPLFAGCCKRALTEE